MQVHVVAPCTEPLPLAPWSEEEGCRDLLNLRESSQQVCEGFTSEPCGSTEEFGPLRDPSLGSLERLPPKRSRWF